MHTWMQEGTKTQCTVCSRCDDVPDETITVKRESAVSLEGEEDEDAGTEYESEMRDRTSVLTALTFTFIHERYILPSCHYFSVLSACVSKDMSILHV